MLAFPMRKSLTLHFVLSILAVQHVEAGGGGSMGRRVFFFQAEDGIRDDLVTGVQTCALPISVAAESRSGAIMNIRKILRRRRGAMAEPAMVSPNVRSVPYLGGGLIWKKQILDRKSTRLNSSHQIISYAVFCL